MEKDIFLKSMRILESALSPNNKIGKDTITIYWERLKRYNDENFKRAVVRCIDELSFFPKVAELKNILDGNQEDEAKLAWIELINKIENEGSYKTVSFPEYPAIGAVVEILGGWLEICGMKYDKEEWVEKRFIKWYPIMKIRGEYPKELAGRFEIDNSNKGYTEEYMLERYRRRLDGTKVDRKQIDGDKKLQIEGKNNLNEPRPDKFDKYLRKE